MTNTYGAYVKLIVVSQKRWGESTNVGILQFGQDGKRLGQRVDTPFRALQRGDLPATWTGEGPHWDNYFHNYLSSIMDVAEVKRAHASMGHAMSFVQLSDMGSCLITPNSVDYLFETLVLGLDTKLIKEAL